MEHDRVDLLIHVHQLHADGVGESELLTYLRNEGQPGPWAEDLARSVAADPAE